MNSKVLALIFAIVCSVSASSEEPEVGSEETEIDSQQLESDCNNETGITAEVLYKIKNDPSDILDDPTALKWSRCKLEGYGLVDADGHFQESSAIEILGKYYDRELLEEIISECRPVEKGGNHVSLYACYTEKLPI